MRQERKASPPSGNTYRAHHVLGGLAVPKGPRLPARIARLVNAHVVRGALDGVGPAAVRGGGGVRLGEQVAPQHAPLLVCTLALGLHRDALEVGRAGVVVGHTVAATHHVDHLGTHLGLGLAQAFRGLERGHAGPPTLAQVVGAKGVRGARRRQQAAPTRLLARAPRHGGRGHGHQHGEPLHGCSAVAVVCVSLCVGLGGGGEVEGQREGSERRGWKAAYREFFWFMVWDMRVHGGGRQFERSD